DQSSRIKSIQADAFSGGHGAIDLASLVGIAGGKCGPGRLHPIIGGGDGLALFRGLRRPRFLSQRGRRLHHHVHRLLLVAGQRRLNQEKYGDETRQERLHAASCFSFFIRYSRLSLPISSNWVRTRSMTRAEKRWRSLSPPSYSAS